MGETDLTYLGWAIALGGLSAVSLPLGSLTGIVLRPRASLSAVLAAFGAGALIAALTLELVAPTVEALGHAHEGDSGIAAFGSMLAGALAGGVLFVLLDRAVAARGGFLRKASTAITWFTRRQHERHRQLLTDLCAVPMLRMLPAEQIGLLVHDVRPELLTDGQILFREGDAADALYFVRSGTMEVERGGEVFRTLDAGSILGELALVTQTARTATIRARGGVEVLKLMRHDFDRWRELCPELDRSVRELASHRLSENSERARQRSEEEVRWGKRAIAALQEGTAIPCPAELRRAAAEKSGSPLAIWLGILIDGVPESIVIGSGFLALMTSKLAVADTVAFTEVIPYTLIAGLFLSNYPEALSSSVGMRTQGWSSARVLLMWTTLLVVTAGGAGVGYLVGAVLPHVALVAIEGVAAGAMLTMIAATMIPEAVHLAGSSARVGLATLFGFLAAVSFKLLE